MAQKWVYFFGGGKAEGNAKMKELLGGKGANLAEMTNLGIPVPPGFTIATKVCDQYYKSRGKWPTGLAKEILDFRAISSDGYLNGRPSRIKAPTTGRQGEEGGWKRIRCQ